MTHLVRFTVDETTSVVVEVDQEDVGVRRVGGSKIQDAGQRLNEQMDSIRDSIANTLDGLRGSLAPDEIKITLGVKFTSEVGAVIAKGSAEGNLNIEMTWTGPRKAKNADGGHIG